MTEREASTAGLLEVHDLDPRTQAELDRAIDLTRIGLLWLGRCGERDSRPTVIWAVPRDPGSIG